MARWFWYFFLYSLAGCGLEKVFALAARAPQRKRKCYLLLPLCPVYGLAMCLFLAVAPIEGNFWVLAAMGGVLCTGVEYAVHLFYDKVFSVQFWDYSGLPCHVAGRICPQFATVWGLLSAWAVRYVQPAIDFLIGTIPPAVTFAAWEILTVDSVFTAAILLRYHDRELLSLEAVWLASQSSRSA